MDGFADLISRGVSEVPFNVLALLIFAWLANRFLDKQQELTMIHNEQMNKMIQSNSELAENLAELVSIVKTMSEKVNDVDRTVKDLREDTIILKQNGRREDT